MSVSHEILMRKYVCKCMMMSVDLALAFHFYPTIQFIDVSEAI